MAQRATILLFAVVFAVPIKQGGIDSKLGNAIQWMQKLHQAQKGYTIMATCWGMIFRWRLCLSGVSVFALIFYVVALFSFVVLVG